MADLVITAADVNRVSGSESLGTAGATITAGQVVYVDASDGNKIKLASNATSAAVAAAVGISLIEDARTGQHVSYQTTGVIDIGATVTVGEVYVLGASGAIHPHGDLLATEYMTVIGVGTDTNQITLALNASGLQLATAGTTGNITTNANVVALATGDKETATSGGAGLVGARSLYLDATDATIKTAANTSQAAADVVGLCLQARVGLSQPVTYQTSGEMTVHTTNPLTLGELYVLSTSGVMSPAGDIATTDWVTLLGVAKDGNTLTIKLFASGVQRV